MLAMPVLSMPIAIGNSLGVRCVPGTLKTVPTDPSGFAARTGASARHRRSRANPTDGTAMVHRGDGRRHSPRARTVWRSPTSISTLGGLCHGSGRFSAKRGEKRTGSSENAARPSSRLGRGSGSMNLL